jgi:hypothetical protein
MPGRRLNYSITPENHEKLLKLQAFVLLDEHRSADLSDLINIAIERMFDGIVEDLQNNGSEYGLMLAEVLKNKNKPVQGTAR